MVSPIGTETNIPPLKNPNQPAPNHSGQDGQQGPGGPGTPGGGGGGNSGGD